MSIWEAKLDWCGLEKKRGEEVGRGEDIGGRSGRDQGKGWVQYDENTFNKINKLLTKY